MFRKRITEFDYTNIAYISYNNIISVATYWCNNYSNNDSLYLIDYLIETIIDDISTSLVSNTIYKKQSHFHKTFPPFPIEYRSDDGTVINSLTKKVIPINLAEVRVLTTPWDINKTSLSLIKLRNESFINNQNHLCYYYKDLSLCYVANGFHSINAGKYLKKGTVNALECDLSRLYPHIETDGIRWADAHNKKAFLKVVDFRLAALFTLGKMKYNILKENIT